MESPSTEGTVFARRLKHSRMDNKLTQARLAAGICSPSAISRWKSGQGIPDAEVIGALADRLEIDPSVLTGRGFDPRLAESSESFVELIHTVFGEGNGAPESHMTQWIGMFKELLSVVDPWNGGADPRRIIDALAVDPLTELTPVTWESAELLEALVALAEDQRLAQVERLSEVLGWTTDAPQVLRRLAVEIAVGMLVLMKMPLAAWEVVSTASLPDITMTTFFLLTLSGKEARDLPPVADHRSSRDTAFSILAELLNLPPENHDLALRAVAIACPQDALVKGIIRQMREEN
ncbi:helix-turn-helix domain-containing protein [Corynebacterium sp. 3HC-13]|uniref:helix-turn-helix domain-containing protein n=1 Tax=Corynebacterium poyangense TaxID=2684405 RepID=UPI001CC9A305|nr:helix-turn-helix transcriptional regulator [Corynebacterium poyangense]MBZ8177688.1 helix-turn-helix domain-containing protein [Corynebacterium poyangense]